MQSTEDKLVLGAFDQLFMSLAEGLKSPMLRIARQAELLAMNSDGAPLQQLRGMQMHADASLRLLDGYLLSLHLARDPQAAFATQPVSVGAVLYETQAALMSVARDYGVEVQIDIGGRYEPVVANARALTAALISLGYSVIEALPALGTGQQQLRLSAHRTKAGIVTGMYFDAEQLTPESLRRGKRLAGHTRQPFVNELPGSAAGVFIADAILNAMQAQLRVGRHRKLPGFAVTLLSSQQLQLV